MKLSYIWVLGLFILTSSFGQRLQDRIDHIQHPIELDAPHSAKEYESNIRHRLAMTINLVNIEGKSARDVFQWWSDITGIPLILNWDSMNFDGIDPEQPLYLRLSHTTARHLLLIMMQQMANGAGIDDAVLLASRTRWYVQIMTKRQANRCPVIHVYHVHDLMMPIPNFSRAPSFNLNDAMSNGSNSSSSSEIFDGNSQDRKDSMTKRKRGQELADLIRNSIEPDLWQANGGNVAMVTYLDGRLIVKAPLYIHQQIDVPVTTPHRPGPSGHFAAQNHLVQQSHAGLRTRINSAPKWSQSIRGKN